MPKREETFGGNTSDVKFDEKKFGERKPSEEDLQGWRDNGWLGEDGICRFPRDVQAYPSGWKAKLPPQFWNKATEAQVAEAIQKGWIMFADGNADYYTLDQYKELYPEYPDPEFIMRLEDRLPPKKGSVIEIGRREMVKFGDNIEAGRRKAVKFRMLREAETFGGNKSDVKLDEKKFGERKPSEEDLQEWRDNGWLGEDGICHFPRDVQAYPSGWKAKLPPQFWNKATEAQIAEAIQKGWIMFSDGNGDYYTLKDYIALYPEYPDPEFIMRLEDRLPPKKGSVIEIGRREMVKIG